MVNFGASAAIVVLERLAHTDPDLLPDDLRLAQFEFPDSGSESGVEEVGALPAGWTRDEEATRRIGGQWQQRRTSSLLRVPSAILPEEFNFVFDPQHPEAKRLRLIRERPFAFDPRLM